jgi:hypothetical protein
MGATKYDFHHHVFLVDMKCLVRRHQIPAIGWWAWLPAR